MGYKKTDQPNVLIFAVVFDQRGLALSCCRCRVRGQGGSRIPQGEKPPGTPTVTDETMGIKIKEKKNRV